MRQNAMTEARCTTRRGRGLARRLARWAENLLAVFGAMVLVYWCCFDYSIMVSESMAPTLQWTPTTRDGVLTERVSYRFRTPRRWEVIAFRNDAGIQVMKRVIGLPGETVRMLGENRILIDGEEIRAPQYLEHLRYIPDGDLRDGQEFPCGEGYFVLGDHTIDSDDSRFVGTVSPESITGRPWLIVQPASRFGFIR